MILQMTEHTMPANAQDYPPEVCDALAVTLRGDVDCSGFVDVSDAVLLARYIAEDQKAVVTAAGKQNADCDGDGAPTSDDVIGILRIIAKLDT